MAGDAGTVVAKVSALGFPVTVADMANLAASVGEKTMIGRTGGGPTFAIGMAQMFAGAFHSRVALSLWYHFAIMFEALFILTTLDAGTRVGRFLMQDLLAHFHPRLGDTASTSGNLLGTGLFVAAWGWFLYGGVVDPNGGINSLWPIFGIANQLLAVIALTLGTTVLIKMGRTRHLWVTLLPLAWLLAVTMTAGWMKIFSADPRLGFLSGARALAGRLAVAAPAAAPALQRLIFNARVDAAVTGLFLFLVAVVVLANGKVWWQLLAGQRPPRLQEDPYVTADVANAPMRS
jgi:carbon starvation protein